MQAGMGLGRELEMAADVTPDSMLAVHLSLHAAIMTFLGAYVKCWPSLTQPH